jgi:hypothetical protein
MGIFGLLKMAAGNLGGIMALQSGSDVLINRHTQINTFSVHRVLRKRANERIKELFLNGEMESMGDICEEEAALLKLSVFYQAAERADDEHTMALLGDAIDKINQIGQDKIRPTVSMQVLSETGH